MHCCRDVKCCTQLFAAVGNSNGRPQMLNMDYHMILQFHIWGIERKVLERDLDTQVHRSIFSIAKRWKETTQMSMDG